MANKDLGFVKIYRSLQEHWIWESDEPFDVRSAWVDLIMSVNHKEKELMIGRSKVTIHAGQMWTSYIKLSNRWNWSRERVYRYIKMLKNEGMIHVDGTPNGTLLTLVNYESFAHSRNTAETTGETTAETSGEASNETPGETQTRSIKNLKNIKNERIKGPGREVEKWQ